MLFMLKAILLTVLLIGASALCGLVVWANMRRGHTKKGPPEQ